MAIKDLAVSYNASSNAKAALTFAIQMCRKYDAALTGLYAQAPLRFEGQVERWITDEVRASLRQAERESGTLDWVAEEGQTNTVLARLARHFDLLLIGQLSEPGDSRQQIRAEELVTLSGKPLIIVPSGYQVRPFTEHAVIAWDRSRPAARALSDAMQILETKKRLDVVTVASKGAGKDKEGGKAGGKAGKAGAPGAGLDIMTHLKRHGIPAERVALSASREGVGATILNYCKEQDADVLVMGAYGHARLREELFGGVTRHVLQNMTVPVLMSH
jgi:nucleotide-binding universal stress UspA family protein